MDKLLILENRFIELKNEGKSLEEIAKILEVGLHLVEKWNSKLNIKGRTTHHKEDLPLTVYRINISNFRGIFNIEIKNLPHNSNWIFLTGQNSFGKTSLLQAIGLYFGHIELDYKTEKKKNQQVSPEQQRIQKIEEEGNIQILLSEQENNSIILEEIENEEVNDTQTKYNIGIPYAAYGPSRLVLQNPESQNKIGRLNTSIYSLFNPDGILLNIEYELLLWKLEKDPRFEIVKELIKSIVPNLHDIIIEGREVLYIEKDEYNQTLPPMPFQKLAAGYRSIIAMVGDMYLRLSKNQTDKDPKELGGIVIIDELDVHLHPKLQRKLPGLLSKAFPKVQFIASTHSPIPFLGAPKNSVFIKVNRSKEEGITAERLDIDVTNLTPNLILTSPIFGMDFITSVNMEKVEKVETEDTYKKLQENRELRERLLEFEKSDRDFPDELFEMTTKAEK